MHSAGKPPRNRLDAFNIAGLLRSARKEALRARQPQDKPRWELLRHTALAGGALILLSIGFGATYATRRDATLLELEEERVLLTYRIQETRALSKNWGYRNDSFDLLQGKHPDFAKLHLRDPDLLGNERIMLFLDLEEQTVFNSLQQAPSAKGTQALPELEKCLHAVSQDLHKPLQSITRICSTSSGPYILGASTITNDTWEAPVSGRVGIFTPVNAPPSASIHNAELKHELDAISSRHLQINSSHTRSNDPWQLSLAIDQNFGLDTPPREIQAQLVKPIAFSANDWGQISRPLLIAATALAFSRQWNLLQRRKARLIKQQQRHNSSQKTRKLQRFNQEHGLLNKDTFARRFIQTSAWNWSPGRQLILIELDLEGDRNSLEGTSITLQGLMPGLCKYLAGAGLQETACQYSQNTILACIPKAADPASRQTSQDFSVASLHHRCVEKLHQQNILTPWALTIAYTTAEQGRALTDQVTSLLLTTKAARKLGLHQMALDQHNPAFQEAQQEQNDIDSVVDAMRGVTPLAISSANVYHCPSSDPSHWTIHHQQLSPILASFDTSRVSARTQVRDERRQCKTEEICHRLGLDHILLKQMSSAASKRWEDSGRTSSVAIRLGKIRPGEHYARAQLLQRCLEALPNEFIENLIIVVDTHNLSDDETSILMQRLRGLGTKIMNDSPGLGLSLECAPDLMRINCKELDQHATDTLISLYRLLQDAGTKLNFQLVGEAICSEAQFHLWHKLGLRLFEGDWIDRMAEAARIDYTKPGYS